MTKLHCSQEQLRNSCHLHWGKHLCYSVPATRSNKTWMINDRFVDPVHNTIIYSIKFFLPIICGGNKRCKWKIKFEKKTQCKCTTTKELYSSGRDIKTRIIWSEIQRKGIYSNVSALGSKRKIKEPSSTSSSATSNYVLQITLTLCFCFFL